MVRLATLMILLAACSAESGREEENRASAPPPRAAAPSPDPCAGTTDYEHCVDFLPAERLRGVWLTGFERSEFIPGAVRLPDPDDPRGSRIWLTFAAGAPDPVLRRQLDEMRTTAGVAIEFVGRRSRHPGAYGHMGGADRLVIVDRLLSARILGPLRPR
ncbi:MAG: hypothetical protein ACXWUP_14665 [Allosphingosinicella sp.]